LSRFVAKVFSLFKLVLFSPSTRALPEVMGRCYGTSWAAV
jgi:hypothetical protein